MAKQKYSFDSKIHVYRAAKCEFRSSGALDYRHEFYGCRNLYK